MERKLKSARNIVNKIVKNIGRSDLGWTVQASINSTSPDVVNYCAQIESPANGLQPVTWILDSYEELMEALKLSEKGLDDKAVEKAYLEAQLVRSETLHKFYEEKLKELEEES